MEIGFIPVTKENIAEAERLAVAPQARMVETFAECWAALEFPLWRPVVFAADGVWVGYGSAGESGGADWSTASSSTRAIRAAGFPKAVPARADAHTGIRLRYAVSQRVQSNRVAARRCTRNSALPSTAGSISTAKR